ncbi:MAG TPA: His-Xaa-Ser system protein HxsD [Puia sp.]|jgi:His-Xaa-Ser system protein HxsD
MNLQPSIEGGMISFYADGRLFSKEAVLKCLYWFGGKFQISISVSDSASYMITLTPLAAAGIETGELLYYLQKLERDLIDFQLRDMIAKETGNIRDLLVAKAFSNGEFEEEPPGDVSDPVGFEPDKLPSNFFANAE